MKQTDRVREAEDRRRAILALLASGLGRPEVARHLGISKQRLSVILQNVSAAELEAALAASAGKVQCPHCGLWVARTRRAGRSGRHRSRDARFPLGSKADPTLTGFRAD